MFRGKDRMFTKEKVKCETGKFTGCSKMFPGKDRLDTKEKVRQEKVKLTGCGKMSPVKVTYFFIPFK